MRDEHVHRMAAEKATETDRVAHSVARYESDPGEPSSSGWLHREGCHVSSEFGERKREAWAQRSDHKTHPEERIYAVGVWDGLPGIHQS